MKKLLNTLYITTADSYLFLQNEAIAVKVGGEEKVRVPANTVDSVYCFGNVTVSTPLIAFCGQRGISLVFLSDYGRFYGRIEGAVHGNVLLRRAQYQMLDNAPEKAKIVQSILLGKLVNSKEFLMRAKREHGDGEGNIENAIQKLLGACVNLKSTGDIDSMRGIEGVAASAYFSVFSEVLKPGTLRFDGRNRRPPEDPVNALLSFLYTLLKNDVQSALEGVGLDPAVGYLHTLRPGRPSLALDLMEEFRSSLCDRMAVSMVNRGQITEKSFTQTEPPIVLTEEARKTVIKSWQLRKTETVQHPFLQESVPIGLLPHVQAMLFARVLRGELDRYPPFHWR